MDKINKALLREVRIKVNEALRPIGKELDLKLSLGNMTYSDYNATGKMKIEVVANGQVMTKEYTDLLDFAELQKIDLDTIYKFNGKAVILTGYSWKSPKYPVHVTELDTEKQFKVSRDWLLKATEINK